MPTLPPPPCQAAPVAPSVRVLFPGRKRLYLVEVCKAVSLSESQVRALIKEGKLGAVDITSERLHWRVPIEALDAFLAANPIAA